MVDVLSRNNVQVSGLGDQPMLFAHGFGCDQNVWRFLTPAFERDYRIVLFDHVGSGRSDASAYNRQRYGTLDGYATDVLEICSALQLQNVVFVAHSVSAMIAILAANREPERFSHLILVVPSPRYLDEPPHYVGGFGRAEIDGLLDMMAKNHMGWAAFFAPVVMGQSASPKLTEDLERTFCANDPEIARQFAQVTFHSDHRADLPGVQIPSLILQCTDDMLAPVQVGRYMHEMMPNSTFHQLGATGHAPHLSDPVETIAAIQSYLARANGTRN